MVMVVMMMMTLQLEWFRIRTTIMRDSGTDNAEPDAFTILTTVSSPIFTARKFYVRARSCPSPTSTRTLSCFVDRGVPVPCAT